MKNINESGRSMVEMLGVLAIIGVLSIGGIAGYTRAMRNWRANEILDAANRVAAMVETELADSNSLTYNVLVDGVKTYGSGDTKPLDKVAGGIVSEIQAYGMAHNTKPNQVEITLKSGNDAVKTLIQEKACIPTTTGTGDNQTTSCTYKISNAFTLVVN